MTPLGKKSGALKYFHKKISRPCPPRVVDNPKRILRRVTLKQTKVFLICKGLHLCLLKVLMVLQVLFLIRRVIYPFQDLTLKAELCQALAGTKRPNIF